LIGGEVTSGSVLVTALVWKDGNLLSNQISISQSTAEIKLLPVSENGRPPFWNFISVFLPNCRHRRVIVHRPTSKSNYNWQSYDVISIFSRWWPAAILDLIWTILDHPRSAIVGLRLVLKCGLNRIYSFGDIAIFIFRSFGLKLPIHAHFGGGGWRAYFPQMTSPSSCPPKGTSLCRNTSFEPWSVKIGSAVRPGRVSEKKDKTVKKVTKW